MFWRKGEEAFRVLLVREGEDVIKKLEVTHKNRLWPVTEERL